ncbi:MAG: MetQ/NlpA family ABC transporter substrate-binding protein [Lactobacillus sp.]|jgi:D-methionine transport system substrate-binding protein|nr:MetQ/NlpA family ABC transporter substrate-binding protein [Lactobacillus sp.]
MKLWKKVVAAVAVALSVFALAACGNSSTAKSSTVKVGIMSNDKEIWQDIQKRLKKQDVNIKLVEFTDYNTPNKALDDGDIQLNSFQTVQFMDAWNKKHKDTITAVGNTYLGPMRAYSNKIKSLKDLKQDGKVSVPNDAANEGRALQLLEANGLIKLKSGVTNPTIRDISENKLNLKISELDAAQTARSMNDVDAAIVNNDIAAAAKLDPKDAINVEKIGKNSQPFINVIAAASKKDKQNKTYKKIVKAYQTKQTEKLMKKYYKGSTVPAWK